VYVGIIDEVICTLTMILQPTPYNPVEVPGNKKDDDGNGYIDDIYGWDFNGNNNTVFDVPTMIMALMWLAPSAAWWQRKGVAGYAGKSNF